MSNNPGSHDHSKAPGQAAHSGERDGGKAAYDAKQAAAVKESVAKQRAADNGPRHESPKKANNEQHGEGHVGHTHDHLAPQSPFHADKGETHQQDHDYYNGMSQ
jgi:hypothetical protein